MNTWAWIDEIVRAVSDRNAGRIADLARALSEAESAKAMLCAKGYGSAAQAIDVLVRPVPEARGH